MDFVLLVLFFVTAPTQINERDKFTHKDQRVWALQSSASLELESEEWCKAISKNIDDSVRVTDTLNVRMYCIPKSLGAYYKSRPQLSISGALSSNDREKLKGAVDKFQSHKDVEAFKKELKEALPDQNDVVIENMIRDSQKVPSQGAITKAIRMNP